MADMFRLHCNAEEILRNRGLEENGRVQKFIDTECLRRCDELVPKDTGILKQSGILCTQIGSGEVKYRTPYARRWYYMSAQFQEGSGSGMGTVGRGNYWFERMKQQYKEQILAGAKRVAGGNT